MAKNELKAQYNLQFGQVKLVQATEVVPINKVWKVESIIYSDPIPNNTIASTPFSTNIDASFILNGNSIVARSSRIMSSAGYSGGTYYTTWEIKLPIWMNAGFSLGSSTGILYLSVIEFNLIP